MTTPFDRQMREALRAPAPPSGGCLDAESLAAWSEGTLDAPEREALEAHASQCDRCQALLAAMIRIEPPLEARPWWRSPAFGWLAPLTVAAAALVIWVRLDQAPAPDLASVGAPAAVAPPAAAPRAANEQPLQKANEQPQATKEKEMKSRQRAEPASTPALAPGLLSDRAAAAPAQDAIGQVAPTAAPALAPVAPAPVTVAPAPPPLAAATPPVAEMVAGGAPSARSAAAESMAGNALSARTAQFSSADQAQLLITTADGSTRWRVTGPGSVQRSTDGGMQWEVQATGDRAILTAGAAPSSTVCWLVGRGGVVLLSVDGRTWRRIPFPEAVDLVSVSAVDEKTASVTTVSGRALTTADGGVSWR